MSFHNLPLKDFDLLQKWVIATKPENFTPATNSYFCSKHFLPDDVYYLGADKQRLKVSVVPFVFAFPERLQQKEKVRKPPSKRNAEENVESSASLKDQTAPQLVIMIIFLTQAAPPLTLAPFSLHLQRQGLEGKSRPYSIN